MRESFIPRYSKYSLRPKLVQAKIPHSRPMKRICLLEEPKWQRFELGFNTICSRATYWWRACEKTNTHANDVSRSVASVRKQIIKWKTSRSQARIELSHGPNFFPNIIKTLLLDTRHGAHPTKLCASVCRAQVSAAKNVFIFLLLAFMCETKRTA